MSTSPNILDVTQADFAAAVLENSYRLPVLVDFWAAWCQPCRALTPLLQRLAEESQGAFLLAKVNTDQEQALAAQFGIRGLPTVKVFRNGQVVDDLVGVQPAAAYQAVIERFRTRPSDRLLAQADAAWNRNRRREALELLRRALADEPDNSEVKLVLADRLLATGDIDAAAEILHHLPLELQMEPAARALLARLEFAEIARMAGDIAALERTVAEHPDDWVSRRQLGARKVLEGDYEAALAQYLEILRGAPNFEEQAGRKGLLALFTLLGDEHPLVTAYRRRMFALLH
jgi:putative thioredoxin